MHTHLAPNTHNTHDTHTAAMRCLEEAELLGDDAYAFMKTHTIRTHTHTPYAPQHTDIQTDLQTD